MTMKLHDPTGVGVNQANLGRIYLAEGDPAQAEQLLRGALTTHTSVHNRLYAVAVIAGLGGAAALRHRPREAVRLLAAAESSLTSVSTHLDPADRADFDRSLEVVRRELDQTAFNSAWARARRRRSTRRLSRLTSLWLGPSLRPGRRLRCGANGLTVTACSIV